MFFSVVVPLYNKEQYVSKALMSVLSQTFRDFELIVVNDGSTDNSLSVARHVLEGSEARIIDQQNVGVSTARNNGVAASIGEYICFLDADDWWEPDFLERMKSLVLEYPEAGIYGCGYYLVKNGKRRVAPIGVPSGFEKGIINYCQVYSTTLCMPLSSISVAIPRPVFNSFDGFKAFLKFGEDFDLWIRIALKHPVVFLNKPLANYNQDVDVASRGTRHLQKPECNILWNWDYLENEEKTNPFLKQLVDNMRVYGLMPYYLSKEYSSAAREQLNKVDWSRQNLKTKRLYECPIWFLRLRSIYFEIGSKVKQFLLRMISQ